MTAAQYSRTIADRLLAAIEDGASLRSACEVAGIPRRSVRCWVERYPAFARSYHAACALRIEVIADEICDLAAQAQEIAATAEDKKANAAVNALRVQIDSKKWLLSKLAPEKYGDRLTMNSDDPLEGMTLDERLSLKAAIEAHKRADRGAGSIEQRGDRGGGANPAERDEPAGRDGEAPRGAGRVVGDQAAGGRQGSDPFRGGRSPRQRRGPLMIGAGPEPGTTRH